MADEVRSKKRSQRTIASPYLALVEQCTASSLVLTDAVPNIICRVIARLISPLQIFQFKGLVGRA